MVVKLSNDHYICKTPIRLAVCITSFIKNISTPHSHTAPHYNNIKYQFYLHSKQCLLGSSILKAKNIRWSDTAFKVKIPISHEKEFHTQSTDQIFDMRWNQLNEPRLKETIYSKVLMTLPISAWKSHIDWS